MKNTLLKSLVLFLLLGSLIYSQNSMGIYSIKDFGAEGKGINYETGAIQKTIDYAASNGGGTVYFPPGSYLTRTIILKDNITLLLDNGTVILGSTDLNKYDERYGSFSDSGGKKFGTALVFAEEVKNIAITGNGIINGQGFEKYYPNEKGAYRPCIIRIVRSENVLIEDVRLINSAAWVQHYVECTNITIRGIDVRSYSNKNNDGIDIEGCSNVLISQCRVDSEDDSIVLKALSTAACQDVVISDCIIGGLKSAIKTGTESLGDFKNITITNCTIYGTRGISLITVDGGTVDNVTISNISMRDSYAVIVMRLGRRMRTYSVAKKDLPKGPGEMKNIIINNIQAVGVTESNDFISGIPGHYIENVTLSNININYLGGGKKEDSFINIEEIPDEYPKAKMFGVLPSYGMYIRHVKNITIKDVNYSYEKPEERSAVVCDDVIDITIMGMKAQSSPTSAPVMRLNNSQNANIAFCRVNGETNTFLETDDGSYDVILLHNDYSGVKNVIDTKSKNEIKIIE